MIDFHEWIKIRETRQDRQKEIDDADVEYQQAWRAMNPRNARTEELRKAANNEPRLYRRRLDAIRADLIAGGPGRPTPDD